ncbi:Arylamine N-acetyltransferase pineal gland isozyme NAT-10 [Dissostichus eleginoides]|uniref:arylamine N-acetyltransferase n=1 Tax=Dissostichus eleginoides TaxID=100907 RepID=A0AAD9F1Q2_DISEL|nr:Arylamine N-acetyltransferase pineal gland isozyme NAT-10 [Dissostichus eleginoides]
MTSVDMHVDAYLSRIGFSGSPSRSLHVLRSVHTLHLLSVPFENLTVHSGGRVQLDPPHLYEKLVKNQTTGFYGPPFDHLVVMVTLDGQRWLCDVGFGVPGFRTPLSLDTRGPQEQGHRVYRITEQRWEGTENETSGMLFLEWQREENRGEDGDWTEIFKFTLDPRRMEDYAEMCQFHQSSPCSFFFCKSLCTILTPEGRLTYIGRRLTTTTFPKEGSVLETSTRDLQDDEIPGVLKEKFGIVLKSPLIPKDEPMTLLPVIY